MNWVAQIFSDVPHLIWGSLITFAGVIYADSRNSRRVERQNTFSAEQSARERLMALRKEVYLQVPAAVSGMQNYLFGLIVFDDEKFGGADSSELADVMAKVTLVSSSETAILAARISMDYGVIHAQLVDAARPAREAGGEARRYARYKDAAIKEYERVLAEHKQELESGQPNGARLDALRESLKHGERQMIALEEREFEYAQKEAMASHEYLRRARDACLPLVELSIKITVALRWELGQPTDHEQFQLEMKRGRDTFLRTSEESLAGLKKRIEDEQN